jgi:hypothetical protein
MSNKRSVAQSVGCFAFDNHGFYPESVATLGTEPYWSWQGPTMMAGYQPRAPGLYRSMGTYLRPYLSEAENLFCPNAPKKPRYTQQMWESGDYWDNPDTANFSDPFYGTYCFYWNYTGYLGPDKIFKGPNSTGGRCGQSTLLLSCLLVYYPVGNWRCENVFGSCQKFNGSLIAPASAVDSDFWITDVSGQSPDSLNIILSAAYSDGHVEVYKPQDTIPMKISQSQDGKIPLPGYASGTFLIPSGAVK